MSEGKNQIPQFISKLLDMINIYPDIIDWNQNNTEIIVKDQKKITELVLPKYFRHSKFESFVRQLNMYNFHKVCRQKNQAVHFKNDIFFKGNQLNFFKIKRKKKNEQKTQLETLYQQKIPIIQDNPQIQKIMTQLIQYKNHADQQHKKYITFLDSFYDQAKPFKFKKFDNFTNEIKHSVKQLSQKSEEIDRLIESLPKIMKSQGKTSLPTSSSKIINSPTIQNLKSIKHIYEIPTRSTKKILDPLFIKKNQFNYNSSFKLRSFRSITSFIEAIKQQNYLIKQQNNSEFSLQFNNQEIQ